MDYKKVKEYVYESVEQGTIEAIGTVGKTFYVGLSVVHKQVKLHFHLCPR